MYFVSYTNACFFLSKTNHWDVCVLRLVSIDISVVDVISHWATLSACPFVHHGRIYVTSSSIPITAVPDHFGTHFTLAFMTNSHNDGGYLKIFVATTEKDTDVTIKIPSLGKTINKRIPGEISGETLNF